MALRKGTGNQLKCEIYRRINFMGKTIKLWTYDRKIHHKLKFYVQIYRHGKDRKILRTKESDIRNNAQQARLRQKLLDASNCMLSLRVIRQRN